MDEGEVQVASAGGEVGVAEGGADASVTSVGDVEGEQPQGEHAGDDFWLAEDAVEPQAEPEAHDDGDGLAEPVEIDARTRANRENAARSTGPRTENGKRRSSLNALKHGAYGEKSLAIPSGVLAEDQDAIEEYRSGIVEALDPRTALERGLAERLANLMLRAERVVHYESAVIGAPPSVPVLPSASADHAYAEACADALHCIDLVSKIDSRISTALQQLLRQYQQVREMGPEV